MESAVAAWRRPLHEQSAAPAALEVANGDRIQARLGKVEAADVVGVALEGVVVDDRHVLVVDINRAAVVAVGAELAPARRRDIDIAGEGGLIVGLVAKTIVGGGRAGGTELGVGAVIGIAVIEVGLSGGGGIDRFGGSLPAQVCVERRIGVEIGIFVAAAGGVISAVERAGKSGGQAGAGGLFLALEQEFAAGKGDRAIAKRADGGAIGGNEGVARAHGNAAAKRVLIGEREGLAGAPEGHRQRLAAVGELTIESQGGQRRADRQRRWVSAVVDERAGRSDAAGGQVVDRLIVAIEIDALGIERERA